MVVAAQSLEEMCIALVEPLGYDIVEIERSPKGQILRVYIDRLDRERITVEDCAAASNALQDAIDASGVDYDRLEVSSPGVDRALNRPVHYQRFVGETVSLKLATKRTGRAIFEAKLVDADNAGFSVEFEGAHLRIEYEEVKKAQLKAALDWNAVEK